MKRLHDSLGGHGAVGVGLAACALALGFISFGCDDFVAAPVKRVTPTALGEPLPSPSVHTASGKFVGVGSCTASGCHGSGAPEAIVGSEYNIWVSQDPHSDAHSVLYDEASLRMVRRLDGKAADASVAPFADPRCLACHSISSDASLDIHSDGVSCEACHGSAEQWLAKHYESALAGRSARGDATALHKLGMANTDDLAERALICAGCHVGDANRDVNHDLIAAGHPRLQFDFGEYMRRMPAHWIAADERASRGANHDALMWAVGQSAASQAALRRLAARAAGNGPWPELAEWSCAACHHDLGDDLARQQRLGERSALSGLEVAWDDWHHHLPRQYMQAVAAAWQLDPQLAEEIPREMAELATLVGDLRSDRTIVAEKATALEAKLQRWTAALNRARPTPTALTELTRELTDRSLNSGLETWIDAALAYDALASLHQSRIAADGPNRGTVQDEQITATISELHRELSDLRDKPAIEYSPDEPLGALKRLRAQLDQDPPPSKGGARGGIEAPTNQEGEAP